MDFTNIPQTYTDLKLVMSARSTRATYADDDVYVNINGLTTNGKKVLKVYILLDNGV